MTLRELLKALNAVDEKFLDMEVMVSPHTGGYDGISHVSVLYVGHPVIHLAEARPAEPPPGLWESQAGDVPAVSADDLKKVWQVSAELEAKNPGHGAIGNTMYEDVCGPGADVTSAWYRASMLWVLKEMMPDVLASWMHDGQLDDVVFEVAATFPMAKMKTGVVREGPPFDVEGFVKRIGARK